MDQSIEKDMLIHESNLEEKCLQLSPFLVDARSRLMEAKNHSENLAIEATRLKDRHQAMKRAIFQSREYYQLPVRVKENLNDLRSSIIEDNNRQFSSVEKLKESIFLEAIKVKRWN